MGFPRQIKYIVGNEAAERFSYYGMAAILTLFLHQSLGFSESDSESLYHTFVFGVYFTPLLGGYLADRFFGKYRTIIWLSLVYVAGHATLAFWTDNLGVWVGLGLIALGAGGIKPCVGAHVGDQFTQRNKDLLPKVFAAFYFSINLGSTVATLAIPKVRDAWGPHVAFAIPGVLMAIALLVFWIGRNYYIYVPPTGKKDDTPGKVLVFAAFRGGLAKARQRFGERAVTEALAVVKVAGLLLPVVMFWALFLQTGSSWVLLATEMDMHGFLTPDMLQAFNPMMVMMMIPLFAAVIYPAFERRGSPLTALRRMRIGMFVTALSFVVIAGLRYWMDQGARPSAFWMAVPYAVLTTGEILVSITGLEFAYTQAPRSVKSTIMSVWYLTIACGSLLAAIVARLNAFEGPNAFLFWAGTMFVVAVIFAIVSNLYKEAEYVEEDEMVATIPEPEPQLPAARTHS